MKSHMNFKETLRLDNYCRTDMIGIILVLIDCSNQIRNRRTKTEWVSKEDREH